MDSQAIENNVEEKKIDFIKITKDMVTKLKTRKGLILSVMSVRKQLILPNYCISIILARDSIVLTPPQKIIGKSFTGL